MNYELTLWQARFTLAQLPKIDLSPAELVAALAIVLVIEWTLIRGLDK